MSLKTNQIEGAFGKKTVMKSDAQLQRHMDVGHTQYQVLDNKVDQVNINIAKCLRYLVSDDEEE